jgi:hypothetical protein
VSTKQLGFSKGSTEGTTVGEGGAVVVVLLDVVVVDLDVVAGGLTEVFFKVVDDVVGGFAGTVVNVDILVARIPC